MPLKKSCQDFVMFWCNNYTILYTKLSTSLFKTSMQELHLLSITSRLLGHILSPHILVVTCFILIGVHLRNPSKFKLLLIQWYFFDTPKHVTAGRGLVYYLYFQVLCELKTSIFRYKWICTVIGCTSGYK